MEFLVSNLGEGRVHHQDQTHGDWNRGGADAEAIEKRDDSGDKPAETHANRHGGEDPGGEITIEEREAASCLHDGTLNNEMGAAFPEYQSQTVSGPADLFDLALDGELLKRGERQREKEADAAVEHDKCVVKRPGDFPGCALRCSGVGNAPVCGHWLAWPI